MYVASDFIPYTHSTSLSAVVSHESPACRLAHFPVLWRRKLSWVISTVLIIASNISQDSNTNSRTACITTLYNKADTQLFPLYHRSSFTNLLHTTRAFNLRCTYVQ